MASNSQISNGTSAMVPFSLFAEFHHCTDQIANWRFLKSCFFFVSPSRLKRPDRTDIAMWKSILTFAALVANAANAASSAASTCDSYEEATLLQLPPLSPDEQDEKDICRFNS
jgi:hypothetical protein